MATTWLLLAVLVIGCSVRGTAATPARNANGEALSPLLKTRPSQTRAAGTVVPASVVHLTLTGQGTQTSKALALNDGLAIFHATYEGSSDFSMVLRDENGDIVDGIADGRGPFDGSTAIGLSDPCHCVVDVQGTGAWSVTVDQPATLTGKPVPVTLTGNGQTASAAFTTTGGLIRFQQAIQSQTGGRVTLLDSDGQMLDVLGDGGAAFAKSRTVELDPGTYLLQVDTDGAWAVDVSTAPASK
jgi:hypothetical protein